MLIFSHRNTFSIIARSFKGMMSIVLFVEMGITGVDGAALMKGWWIGFVDTTADDLFPIIGIIGAIVMPHNLYLHTATLQSRPLERKEDTVLLATKNASWEPFVPVLFTFFISMAVMSVAAGKSAFVFFYHVHMCVQCEVSVIWLLYLSLHCIHLLALATHMY